MTDDCESWEAEQADEVTRLRAECERLRKDWCEDDESIKRQALRVLPASVVEGDTWHVPRMGELAELMADECERLKKINDQFAVGNYIDEANQNAILKLNQENERLRESLPLVDNRTRDEARNLFGRSYRFKHDGTESSYVDLRDCIDVTEQLIAEQDQLRKDVTTMKQENERLRKLLKRCEINAIIPYPLEVEIRKAVGDE